MGKRDMTRGNGFDFSMLRTCSLQGRRAIIEVEESNRPGQGTRDWEEHMSGKRPVIDRFGVTRFRWAVDGEGIELESGTPIELQAVFSAMLPEDRCKLETLRDAIRAGRASDVSECVQWACDGGEPTWVRIRGKVSVGAARDRVLHGVAVDVSEEIRRARDASSERDELRDVLENLPDGVIIAGPDRVFRFANHPRGYEPYRRPEEVVGHRFRDLLPPGIAAELEHRMDLSETNGTVEMHRYEVEMRSERRIREARFVTSGLGKLIVVTRDITAQAMTEQAVGRREAILGVVADGADRFLRGRPTDDTINEMIARLGVSTNVGRVYVFETRESPPANFRTTIRYEWHAPGLPPILHDPLLQDTEFEFLGFQNWIPIFLSGGVIRGTLSDFPGAERDTLQRFGVESLVVAPIFVGDRWWGLIGFADYEQERIWAQPEADALNAAAAVLGAAVERRQVEESLRASEERWKRLVDNHPGPILVCRNNRIVYLNAAAVEVLGAHTVDEALGHSLQELVPEGLVESCLEPGEEPGAEGLPVRVERRLTGFDGVERIVEAISVPIIHEGRRAMQTVLQDVTERRRHERQLIEAKEQAEEMNRLKSTFLANMSHEIRTPLTSIIGYADLLADESTGKAGEFARLIEAGANRLLDTLNSVLDLAQLEGGARRLIEEELDAAEQARLVCDLYRPRFEQKGIRFTFQVEPGENLRLEADRRAFGRILVNLIDNALKFTNEGAVTLRLGLREAQLCVQVVDTGIGVSPEFLPYLFEDFKQQSEGLTRKFGGSGLGLAISRRLVQLMGGSIEAESVSGRGSAFTVLLPLRPPPRTSD